MSDQKGLNGRNGERREEVPDLAIPQVRRSRFGAAAEGWEAYNSWLTRVRQAGPTSRQAVISKALYSVSSYRNWADKAKGAFDKDE
jgi:hypothetical protein